MATTTPNFGWPVPTSTDLVKDGATAIEALGDGIDTSMVDLKGGLTGQVLSKTTNADMDFTWVTSDDANAIQNTIVDAKGDLISASASDVPARLAVGANGETLVADSSTSTGLRYTAGNPIPNPVLNSAFQIAQRGTSFASSAITSVATSWTLDRWGCVRNGFVAGGTFSRQNTNDTTNLPSIQYCLRASRDSGNTSTAAFQVQQPMETINSIPFVGKTVTLSFYARAGANYSGASSALLATLLSGTGTDQNPYTSYTGQATPIQQSVTLTTTWQRFTITGTIATTATELATNFQYTPSGTAGAADYFEITGIQLDIGSVALPFRTNGATIQGELAACQRYYQRFTSPNTTNSASQTVFGMAQSTTVLRNILPVKTTMRTAPSSIDFSNLQIVDGVSGYAVSSIAFAVTGSADFIDLLFTASGLTQFRGGWVNTTSSAGYLGVSAEL